MFNYIVHMRHLYLIILICFSVSLSAQRVTVFGRVLDDVTAQPVGFATVFVDSLSIAAETDANGMYSIKLPAEEMHTLQVARLGYNDGFYSVPKMPSGSKRNINFSLLPQQSDVVVVTSSRVSDLGMVKEEVQDIKLLPTASGNLESALPSIALGTSSGTGGELSSQYNVRGGNYDENLVYVNDFEIFRPQLISSSQQEGLSFPNIDLIQNLSFSSGGFAAQYGDKLSSVLDIKYKRPEVAKYSVALGLLGGSVHTEGAVKLGANAYNKLRYLLGVRYKTTKLLLGSQNVKGQYQPSFTDIQTYITYDLTRDWQIAYLGNVNNSLFDFVPESGETTFGAFNDVRRFRTYYEGQEKDQFFNSTSGISLNYVPDDVEHPFYLKFLASGYSSTEVENYDIIGEYFLSTVESGLGAKDEDFGKDAQLLGTGIQHKYARNRLYNTVINLEHKGGKEYEQGLDNGFQSHFIQWSVKYQREQFDDRLNEWERLDSADYNLPFHSEKLTFDRVIKSENKVSTDKVAAYGQYTYSKKRADAYEIKINAGVRVSYRGLNNEWLVSPRAQLFYKPLGFNKNLSFKLAAGVYYQQPFYREMRRSLDGTLNTQLASQRSIHIVTGLTYDFLMKKFSDKPFRYIAELYYKRLDNLVSFDLDNVRIRYSGENDAVGYVLGLDMRINGEFVPGVESWINVSLLKARERLVGVQHLRGNRKDSENPIKVDYVPRPTGQLLNVGVYFQDYLPMDNRFKANVGINFGSGLPYGLPGYNTVYRNVNILKPYHRVDIGFGYQLWDSKWLSKKPNHPLRFADNCWISVDVFNLMKVSNQAGVNWIKDYRNIYTSIPNNLTSRRISARFRIEF